MKRYNFFYMCAILFVVYALSIGFAAFESSVVVDNIAATVRMEENIRVSAFDFYNATSSAKSTYNDYAEELLLTNINLPNADSTITYQVTVTNYGNMEMGIYEFNNLPSNLTYETSGYQMQDKICESTGNCTLGASKTFYLTIKYKENGYNSANTNYSLNIGVDFRTFYTVTYENITNNGYPTEIIAGGNLVINFDNSVSGSPIVSLGEQVVSTSIYSFTGGVLTYNNVTGNIKINGRSLSSIAITTSPQRVMYNIGEQFDPNGMVVTATYSDGSTKEVTNYNYMPNSWLNESDTTVTITYSENGQSATTTQEIQVGYIITVSGSSSTYDASFCWVIIGDRTIVSSEKIMVSPGTTIKMVADTSVTINGNNVGGGNYEHVVTSPISIYLYNSSSMNVAGTATIFAVTAFDFITTPPSSIHFTPNSTFSPSGMVVTHVHADGTKETVTDYTVSPSGPLTTADTFVTISYSREGNTYTTNLPIEVSTGCFVEGTLITLADGSKKPIEEITYYDEILTWDFHNGKYAVSRPSLIEAHYSQVARVLNLQFSDDTSVRVVVDHGFFDVYENKFVFLNESNIKSYIGHKFVKDDGDGTYSYVELIDYSITEDVVDYYTIQTSIYNNCIAEGMLTLTSPPVGYNGWFDYFEIGNNMKYDEFKKRADIAKYGLYSYEEFSEYVTYEQFMAFNGPYLKVLVGKGYLTKQQILDAVSYYLK